MPKLKNILIFLSIGVIFVLIYIFFIKPPAPTSGLVSSAPNSSNTAPATQTSLPKSTTTPSGTNFSVTKDFLDLLLNVKNIKLDDAIFTDEAFLSLHDSSITLIPDGNEGRINPFAPIGSDAVLSPTCTTSQILNTTTNTCVTRATCTALQFLNTTTNTCVARTSCTLPQVLNSSTNTCVTPITCTLPQIRNTATNTCFTPVICTLPQVRNTTTNTCVNPPVN